MKIREARTPAILIIAVIAAVGLASGCTAQAGSDPPAHQTQDAPNASAKAKASAAPSGDPCVKSAHSGSCGPYKYSDITASNGYNTYVANDVWNPIPGATQTMTATGPGRWSAVANMPAGNTAVVSYPNTMQIFTTGNNSPDPVSNFSKIVSTFRVSIPHNAKTSAQFAFDVWSGQSSKTDSADEMMIWVDIVNRGTCGGATVLRTASFGGSDGVPVQTWRLCRNGSAGPKAEYIWYLTGAQESSGKVNILVMEKWMITHGYYPAGTGINMIDFGAEVCSTGGTPEKVSLSAYTLTTS